MKRIKFIDRAGKIQRSYKYTTCLKKCGHETKLIFTGDLFLYMKYHQQHKPVLSRSERYFRSRRFMGL